MLKQAKTQTQRERGNFRNLRKFPRRIFACPPEYFAFSCISLARVSQSNKEMAYVTPEEYLQEELLTELTVPGFLNHMIYVDNI